jgi:hypothetical protein
MIFNKYFGLFLLTITTLYAQSAPEFFKDTSVRHGLNADFNNPAAIQSLQRAGASYGYDFERTHGNLRHPFAPASIQNHTFTAAGYKVMRNKTLFSGSFSYRQNFEGNRLFRHNSSLNGMLPVYMADSSSGDWHLNGIQWTVDIMKPLTEKLSGGFSVFYMVDEQYKQTFPKPGVKRSGYLVKSGLFYSSPALKLSSTLGVFELKEEMSTVKYSLEQNLNPVFMLFRGYEDPIIYRGMTSYERLQSRQGLTLTTGVSFNFLPRSPLLSEVMAEWSRGKAVDGGTDNLPQGDWITRRVNSRLSWTVGETNRIAPLIKLYNHHLVNEAEHPDFPVPLFKSEENIFQGFAGLSLRIFEKNTVIAGLSMENLQVWREDAYNGIGLENNSTKTGPSLTVSVAPPMSFEADLYVMYLKETNENSQIKVSLYREDKTINPLTNEEFWAMTAGDNYIEAGAEIRLKKVWQNGLIMKVNYRLLADRNGREATASRDCFALTLTIIPHLK